LDHLYGIENVGPATTPASAWRYWRPDTEGIIELATVQGVNVALADHFHKEDQLTFVVSGQRRFLLGKRLVHLMAGEGACIPAGTPHRSLPEPHGVHCFNLYLPAGEYATSALLDELAAQWRRKAGFRWLLLHSLTRDYHRHAAEKHPIDVLTMPAAAMPVHQVARQLGMSREGYSRAFRRSHGMPPQAFGLVLRLNHARDLLRKGIPVAEVAVSAGFSDQSHLGRCFRHAFGVTPGRYRAG
jgi:AraC-like DNA-binding protein